MSVVAFTFGSLGDIITLLQLADRVRKALYNTKDSSAEFRDVILELDSIVFTVAEVQKTLSLPGSDRLSQSVENALYHAMGICLDIITKMNERIAMRRMASRGAESVGAMAIDTWQRIGWTLFKKEELLVLRRRLSGQIEAINTLLALAQGDRMDRIGSQMASVNAEVACVSNEVGSVSDAVAYLREESRKPYVLIREIHRCATNLSHKLGYLWEGDPSAGDKPVTLTDILGHTVVLPWELVATERVCATGKGITSKRDADSFRS
ncbi:hypothetical protein EWM64_g5749 [Hericium alpestre]|uniref:Fungal N-terminal domain-containing protein n=1 Tax=Hericium alpestre TaxID=135208 RepID=A0A4Y9ZTM8_9AGAM|nr:hypothetical protein EWM64_g5749 [Hericium alpestre]